MREKKFRAWDRKNKRIFQVYSFDTVDSGCIPRQIKGEGIDDLEFVYAADCDLLEYTGLTDRNGKGICEGDLCRDSTGVSRIVWHDTFASFCLVRKGWLSSHFFGEAVDPEDVEVIGNIYENPELLSKEA